MPHFDQQQRHDSVVFIKKSESQSAIDITALVQEVLANLKKK